VLSKNSPKGYEFEVDGKKGSVPKASEIFVNDDFKVIKNNNYRVNVIGFYKKGKNNESNINIKYRDLNQRYSVDKDKKVYRVEFYNKNKFCSMIMVHFK
jgi:hypothetical protein